MNKTITTQHLRLLLQLFEEKQTNVVIYDPEWKFDLDVEFSLLSDLSETPSVLFSSAPNFEKCLKNKKGVKTIISFGFHGDVDGYEKKTFRTFGPTSTPFRWLFSRNNLKKVLPFYSKSTLRARLLTQGIKMAGTFGLERFLAKYEFTVYTKSGSRFDALAEYVEADEYSIFTGTEGEDRKATVALFKGKNVTHFAKVALEQNKAHKLINEVLGMCSMKKQDIPGVLIPDTYALKYRTMLLTTNGEQNGMYSNGELSDVHFSFLHNLFKATNKTKAIKDMHNWNKIEYNIFQLKDSGLIPNVIELQRMLLNLKNSIDENEQISCTYAHGDFTPWNMKFNKKEIYLFDWEYFDMDSPAFYDLFHYYFQTGIILKKQSVEQILEEINNAFKNEKLQMLCQKHEIDIELHLRLYLLRVMSYNLMTFMKQDRLTVEQQKQLKVWGQLLKELNVADAGQEQREVFISDFYQNLRQVRHAVLKFDAEDFSNLSFSSDIDIAIRKESISYVLKYIDQYPLIAKSKVVSKSFMTEVQIFFKDGSFLSIDLINQFKRKGIQMMDIQPLLRSAAPNMYGIIVPDIRFDLEYMLLFYSLNKANIPEKYKAFFLKSKSSDRRRACKYLNLKYDLSVANFEDFFHLDALTQESIQHRVLEQSFQTKRFRLKNYYLYVIDTLKSFRQNKGFVISISGVDGVGKSTIIKDVSENLALKYRKEVVLLRHRPRILPILSSLIYGSSEKAEKVAGETLPRQGTNKSIVSSLFRFSYYFVDYLFGQVYIYFKYIIRGKIVLYDRFYFDFIADSKRSNIRLNKRFIKSLSFFIVKPRLNVLLWAKPSTILKRKQELERESIQSLTKAYIDLFSDYNRKGGTKRYCMIENTVQEETTREIIAEFMKVA